ncbi:hypothetical protein CYMTET_27616 [Cymbomonas tetramitiformis]|uniref:Uncharacterized protein n=1 Tax=Cymbomonas tetramitiformis TaxID=36881 RepID=A0AAE0FQ01_9CHLO|nr:hypothetical protein CYMTET_27616 [Cymbomonas tetramitiformis]
MRELLEKGAEVDAEDAEGRTALTGAEVDAEDGEGRTALTVALAFGKEAAARALLEAGAGVNAGTGRRPLHGAAEGGMVEILRELVDKGAEVDAEDGAGRTALTVALAFGQEAAARALLEAGAGVNAGTGRPVHARERGMEEMVRELVGKGVEVDAEDGEGRTALTVALAFGQEGAARALLKAGAGVNAGTGRRPFHAAAERGMVVMIVELVGSARAMTLQEREVPTLIAMGADVNAGKGQRALHLAAKDGLHEVVRQLLEAGAELGHADDDGALPAWLACSGDSVETVRLMKEAGADFGGAVQWVEARGLCFSAEILQLVQE